MTVNNIVDAVNAKLAGETLTLNQMRLFLNEAVDDMNRELNSCYPDFDELSEIDSYDYIPNMYIRSVIVLGAACKFYITDEEGIQSAVDYKFDYATNLFMMKRDFSDRVPEEYQADRSGAVRGPDIDGPITVAWRGW